jgi:hypothetical protein
MTREVVPEATQAPAPFGQYGMAPADFSYRVPFPKMAR